MSSDLRTLLTYIGALGVTVGAVAFLMRTSQPSLSPVSDTGSAETAQTASVSTVDPDQEPSGPQESPQPLTSATLEQNIASIERIQNPYPSPSATFASINQMTRAALVNIFCTMGSGVNFRSTSGSGVVIDPRGVILTNAHVAQYVLLAESGRTSLSCSVRAGGPARDLWGVEVLYMPPIWVKEHAADIRMASPTGTGEHDYALLRITRPIGGAGPATPIPYLPIDSREAVAFPTDYILAASYPSEFVGSGNVQFDLYPLSSIAPVKELLTFGTQTPDLLSLEGVAEAQSGSSGGPVVNAWGYVVGIITTTSEGITTAERELRALALSYIDRDILVQTGLNLNGLLSNDLAAVAQAFKTQYAPALTEALIDEISKPSH